MKRFLSLREGINEKNFDAHKELWIPMPGVRWISHSSGLHYLALVVHLPYFYIGKWGYWFYSLDVFVLIKDNND